MEFDCKKLAVVGAGNMSSAIIGGLIASSTLSKNNIYVSTRTVESSYRLSETYGLNASTSNVECIKAGNVDGLADVILFGVKPQILPSVIDEIKESFLKAIKTCSNKNILIVSIAAGVRLDDLAFWLGVDDSITNVHFVRVMPNTPSLLGEGATGCFAKPSLPLQLKNTVDKILGSVSKSVVWVEDEVLINAVTAVSGSGPAYFFLLVELIAKQGESLGLPRDVALKLASQTCLGAGRMLCNPENIDSPEELRRKVTSPNGTTDAAIKTMFNAGISESVQSGVKAAYDRGIELGNAKK